MWNPSAELEKIIKIRNAETSAATFIEQPISVKILVQLAQGLYLKICLKI